MRPVVIQGCGGHACVLSSALRTLNRTILAAAPPNPDAVDNSMFACEIISDDRSPEYESAKPSC